MGIGFERDWDERLSPRLRTMQVIVVAMAFGVLSFLLIVVFLRLGAAGPQDKPAPPSHFLLSIGLAFTCGAVVARLVIPGLIEAQGRRQLTADLKPLGTSGGEPADLDTSLMGIYLTRLIIAGALLEGAAFFMIIVFMLEQSPWSLLVAAVLIGLILALIPTRQRVSSWLAKQREQIDEDRLLRQN